MNPFDDPLRRPPADRAPARVSVRTPDVTPIAT
ncbi:hypothetical protein OV320_1644 [Actinobacteria bacterium OV320]|nr:hypothetical protein OV320_1644 [Actinobacteria bacterium OV320]